MMMQMNEDMMNNALEGLDDNDNQDEDADALINQMEREIMIKQNKQ